jgi:pyroglutamyl-peptidase
MDEPTQSAAEPVLLVTGFDPFGDYARNPSGDVAARLDGQVIAGVRLVGRRLEVSWRRAWPALAKLAEQTQPACVLALGVAPHPFIRLEVLAKNACLPDEDIDGERPSLGSTLRILEGAPAGYWTTLPVDDLEHRLRSLGAPDPWACAEYDGVPVTRWADAGSYLCNYVFFNAMHHLGERIPRVGLVHIPPYRTEATSHAVDDDTLVDAIVTLVREVATLVRDGSSTPR